MTSSHPRPAGPTAASACLLRVTLEGEALTRLSALMEADRAQAVADLEAENRFAPHLRAGVADAGPYALRLSIYEGRLVFDIRRADDTPWLAVGLALGPFRALIRDYHLLMGSYARAVEEGREARIQAIDMGRRGLHNEGAELMIARLEGKVDIDFNTARRLFTLLCVLHRGIRD
jgi:uncharacterized protein (UPF0262 family)